MGIRQISCKLAQGSEAAVLADVIAQHPPLSDSMEKKAIAKPNMNSQLKHACPYCGSPELDRSTRRGPWERFILPVFRMRPYRCRDCDRRHYAKQIGERL